MADPTNDDADLQAEYDRLTKAASSAEDADLQAEYDRLTKAASVQESQQQQKDAAMRVVDPYFPKMRNALTMDPNSYYYNLLPMRQDAEGKHWALPAPVYAAGNLMLDAAEAVPSQKITPQLTAAMLTASIGLPYGSTLRAPIKPFGAGPLTADAPATWPISPKKTVPAPVAAEVSPEIAPSFVPPGSNVPVPIYPRIRDLINADTQMAANKPSMIPPSTVTDVQGGVTPLQQPPNPLMRGPTNVPPAVTATPILDSMKLAEDSIPTADPTAPQTIKFAQMVQNNLKNSIRHAGMGLAYGATTGAGLGHPITGAAGGFVLGLTGDVLAELTVAYGPKIAAAVVKAGGAALRAADFEARQSILNAQMPQTREWFNVDGWT